MEEKKAKSAASILEDIEKVKTQLRSLENIRSVHLISISNSYTWVDIRDESIIRGMIDFAIQKTREQQQFLIQSLKAL